MLIGELAERTATTAKTLRFYEDEGLLLPPARTPAGYRDYPAEAADRVGFVREAQAAGFTLRQIRQILDISDTGEPPCVHVGELIEQRLEDVERRIAELQRARHHLAGLTRRGRELDPVDCTGYCQIIHEQPE
ncbi:MAG: heavy metal-responsive transcriptional regulator [Jiangellaceae bacterium]